MSVREVAFILVPKFSMIALYGALEPLRIANRFIGEAFSWRFASLDGEAVAASNGIPVSVSSNLSGIGEPALAVICASYEPQASEHPPILAGLRRLGRAGVPLGALDTGPFLLAAAGLLDGRRATCHWESLPGFRERFPSVQVTERLYEIDGDRLTCAGGAAAIDMMLDWIGGLHGRALAIDIADQLIHSRNAEAEAARLPASARYGLDDPRIEAVIRAMEEHVEDPLDAGQLAAVAGLSGRQLERVFKARMGVAPKRFYLGLRLEKAERLLTYSRMSVRDVAVATGFSSLALFSRAYRVRYGLPPSRHRRSAEERRPMTLPRA
ncbi:MAG: GlxA family transcriptional regulator [Parvibaculaceae bacterium]